MSCCKPGGGVESGETSIILGTIMRGGTVINITRISIISAILNLLLVVLRSIMIHYHNLEVQN